jgi:hypothetical protein
MTDPITLPRATVQQALEAWEYINKYGFVLADYEGPMEQAITALKAALEQPEQDVPETDCGNIEWADIPKEFNDWWDADRLTQTNPFREDSPAYWAWEGWQARAALEKPEPEQEPVAWACFKNGELQTELVGTEADVDFWCASDEPEMQGMVKGALYTHPPRRETEPAFDALVAISLLTHLGGEVADYEDVVEAVRRLHALNGELLEALKRISATKNLARELEAEWCPAATGMVRMARAAIAKAEEKV